MSEARDHVAFDLQMPADRDGYKAALRALREPTDPQTGERLPSLLPPQAAAAIGEHLRQDEDGARAIVAADLRRAAAAVESGEAVGAVMALLFRDGTAVMSDYAGCGAPGPFARVGLAAALQAKMITYALGSPPDSMAEKYRNENEKHWPPEGS